MVDLLLMSRQPCQWFLRVIRRSRRPKEEGVVVRARDEELWLSCSEFLVACQGERLGVSVGGGKSAGLVIGTCAEDEVGVECHRVDPVSMVRKRSDELALRN